MDEGISLVVTFAAGAVTALGAQWLSNALARRRERTKEYWIRRLNSYQDAYHAATHLTHLLEMGNAPPDLVWQVYGSLSKSVDDAVFYSPEEERLLHHLQEVMGHLSRAIGRSDRSEVPIKEVRDALERLRYTFYDSERLLMRERARWRKTSVKPR